MEINEFIGNLAEQFDETTVDNLHPNTVYKNLDDWSSIVALSVIAMIDEEYSVTIKGEDISNTETVQDLFTIVKGKMQ